MISDIWQVARKFNSSNFISGHLSFTKSLYVVQLLEGLVDHVCPLMERIKKDPRVVIEKVFTRKDTDDECWMGIVHELFV